MPSIAKLILYIAIGFLAVHWLTGGQDEIINGYPNQNSSYETPVDRVP